MKLTEKSSWFNITMILFVLLIFFSDKRANATEYIIGVEDLDYLPYYTVTPDGNYSGFAKELLDTFARENGYRFSYRPLPLKRLFKSLVNGKIDFKFPDNPLWKNKMKAGHSVIYSASVVKTIDGLLILPENAMNNTFKIKTIGTIMGFTPWLFQEGAARNQFQISENSSLTGLFKQVLNGRIDAAYANPVVAAYFLEHKLNNQNGLVFDNTRPFTVSLYHMSTIRHIEIMKQFDHFLQVKKREIDQLKHSYKISEAVE